MKGTHGHKIKAMKWWEIKGEAQYSLNMLHRFKS